MERALYATPQLEKGLIDRYLAAKPEWRNDAALCVSGSYYNGEFEQGRSDVDLMRFSEDLTSMQRSNDLFEGTEVNTYSLSTEVLAKDVRERKYGFWYINRFLVPHHFLQNRNHTKEKIYGLVAEFLEDYAFPDIFSHNETLTLDQVIARTYLLHLNDFPSLVVALQKACQGNDFSRLREHFSSFLRVSSLIQNHENRYSYYGLPPDATRALYHEKIRLTRWEAWRESRAASSGVNPVLRYIEKQEKAVEQRGDKIQEFMQFLHQAADRN